MDGSARGARVLVALAVVVLTAWFGASSAGAAVTCSPTINPSGTPVPGTAVAPGLRVVSTQWGSGTCPEPFFVSARAADGTIWAVDYNNSLWKSTNDLRTLQRTYTATAYAQIEQVLPLASGTVLIVVRDASGNRFVLRSADASGTSFGTTPVLALPAGASLHDSASWTQVGGAVYIGQYGGGPPVHLWKSTDDGQTFSTVWQGSQSDEIHAVQGDPYHPGRIWIMTDGIEHGLAGGTLVGYSDDGGATWTWVTNGSYPESRVVDLMFDAGAVYWGTDSPDVPSGLFRYDRTTAQVTQVMSGLNGPFYGAVSYDGQFAQFSAVEPSSGYIGDQNIHVLTNGDGTSWNETATPWSRDQGNTAKTALAEAYTAPDSQGRFWVSYYDLAGSPNLESNIEFQFDPSATTGGLNSAFSATPNPFTVGSPVSFDGSASLSPTPPVSYLWNFGDGTTASGQVTESHAYGSSGHFTASLQVKDASNNAALSTVTLSSSPQSPTASTGAASPNAAAATLYGDVTPNGASTSAFFEYGTSTSYGSQTATQQLGSGISAQRVTAALSGLAPGTTYHYRLDAVNANGTTDGSDGVFTTPTTPTTAVTGLASSVGVSSATLNGNVNPSGLETTVYFNYGTTTAYGSTTAVTDAGSGSSTELMSAPISGLALNTTYHFQVIAVNQSGTFVGPDQTFTTLPPPPSVSSGAATFVGSGGGTLNGIVNPNGDSSTAYFEYGTTTAYGMTTSAQNVGSGSSPAAFSAVVSGLAANMTYHYRLDAVNANGTTVGADQTFTTTAGPPLVTTGAVSGVSPSGATVAGTVDPQGQTASTYFQYGITTAYGSQTATQTLPGNLITNPGCANGTTTGWRTEGSVATTTFQSQTGWASVGPASCRFTTGSIASGGYAEAYLSPSIQNITPGTQYKISADLNVLSLATGQSVVLYVGWLNSAGANLSKIKVGATKATGTTTLSGTLTAPANTVRAQITVTVENAAGAADLYFDNTQLQAAGTGTLQNTTAQLTALHTNTTYHYRTVATTNTGTSYGPDQTFTTAPPPDTTPPTSTAVSPLYSNSSTFSVTYTAADNPGGSGVGEVDLYAQAPGQSGYSKVAVAVSGSGSGSFNYTATAGDGTYSFYTVATDLAANMQPTPPSAQATTVVDTTPPTSAATSPAVTNNGSWTGSYTASDSGSGVTEVDLYAQAPGQSGYTKVATAASGSGSGSFNYTATAGDGTYSFYTVATDVAGNAQAVPATAQTTTVLDTTTPTSAASSPAVTDAASFTVSYTASDNTGGSGVTEVDLYAQAPGQNAYTKVAADTSGSGSGSFNYTATAGDGTYSFYTVATDLAGNAQAVPATAQTTTVLDTTTPTSAANSPGLTDTASFTVSYTASDNTGGSGLAEVDLYAQAPGQNAYTKVAVAVSGSGSGSFNYTATAGDGTYSFYTVATDAAGNVQATPSSAQTTTHLDTSAPTSSATSPSLTNKSTWSVAYTASAGGSGLAEVDLYAQTPGQSGFTKIATAASGSGSGSFNYTASAGDGAYSFYTIATSKAGDVQAAPSSAQAVTLLDTTPPTSTASAPAYSNTATWQIPYTASDAGSGITEVDLYAQAPGQNAYTKVAADTSGSGSGSFNYTATAGDGPYSFYTVATDVAGNVQAAPSSAQSTTLLDTMAPTSAASSPPLTASSSWTVSYRASDNTGGSGLAEVDLYAQAPGQTGYTKVASKTNPASTGGLTYSSAAGNGTYSFYTIAIDRSGNVQTTPAGAQTTTKRQGATATTVAAPATAPTGTAIASTSISSKLSGAATGATGTITFTVFGPQASAPATCTTGGTAVGTAAVNGNRTYHPSAGFTPSVAGTYWWYASYSGDTNDLASATACSSAMTSTLVKNATTNTVAAAGTATLGTPVAPSSVSARISGATSGASGTVTFEVFGPQATAPTSCGAGGTVVGAPQSISGNGTYDPSTGFTPSAAGDYWWYALYSGDSSNTPSNSTCGAAMAETVVYSVSSVASATDTQADSSTTTSSFTVAPNTTYMLVVARHSQASDSLFSISSTGLTPALSKPSFTTVGTASYGGVYYQSAYAVTTAATASGSGTLTLNFTKPSLAGGVTIVDVIKLGGSSTAAMLSKQKATATGSGTSPTANLTAAPSALDAEVVLVNGQQDLGSPPASTPAMTSVFYSHQAAGTEDVLATNPASQTNALSLSAPANWATLVVEVRHG